MHSNEFISTENGFKVLKSDGTIVTPIGADGSFDPSLVLATDAVTTVKIKDSNVTLAKLATLVSPSHVVKFVRLGSTITTTALAGLAVGDVVIQIIAATSTVTCKLCASIDTLPTDPADLDYIIVLRATA